MSDLRVLVVADNLLTRAGLAALLATQPGLDVIGQAGAGEALADDLDVYRPDAVVWDLGWDARASLEQLGALVSDAPPVVALLPDDIHAAAAAALLAGSGGLLHRDCGADQLGMALLAAAGGLLVIDPALAGAALAGSAAPEAPIEALTPREREVLQLLAEGLSNKAIALRLDISDHTVKFHVNAIMTKLDAQSRTDAVVRAMRLGLVLL
jgi:DNA-binding NarL/FixJ family response regulator